MKIEHASEMLCGHKGNRYVVIYFTSQIRLSVRNKNYFNYYILYFMYMVFDENIITT